MSIINSNTYKLTSRSSCHNGFQYREGMNRDTLPFRNDDMSECAAGGLYYSYGTDILYWTRYIEKKMYYIWDVTVPEDALQVKYRCKSKANYFRLSNRRRIKDLPDWADEDFCRQALTYNCYNIRFIHNPTDSMMLSAVTRDGRLIRYLPKAPHGVRKRAVSQTPYAVLYIENPNEQLPIMAILQKPRLIQFITKPSRYVQMTAVKYDMTCFRFILDPHPDVVTYACPVVPLVRCESGIPIPLAGDDCDEENSEDFKEWSHRLHHSPPSNPPAKSRLPGIHDPDYDEFLYYDLSSSPPNPRSEIRLPNPPNSPVDDLDKGSSFGLQIHEDPAEMVDPLKVEQRFE